MIFFDASRPHYRRRLRRSNALNIKQVYHRCFFTSDQAKQNINVGYFVRQLGLFDCEMIGRKKNRNPY
jgi:hypothetical protein